MVKRKWVERGHFRSADDVDDAATATGAEFDSAWDQREQGVVAATADAGTRWNGFRLADDDLAGIDEVGRRTA